jgi:outer membrane protein OmpA-like peptidoglycan-associated protein
MFIRTASVVAITVVSLSGLGCATKKYVSKEVGAVNEKVETLGEAVERNQERIGRAEESITRQDGEIRKVDAKADEAGHLAASAQTEAERAFQQAERRAMKGKLLYEVTLSNDKVSFALNASELSPDAQVLVNELAEKVKADNRGLWIEVEGHTDASGDPAYNKDLGLKRAEAVRDYLYQTHGIPLHRISVYSFGEAARARTTPGRPCNRRGGEGSRVALGISQVFQLIHGLWEPGRSPFRRGACRVCFFPPVQLEETPFPDG